MCPPRSFEAVLAAIALTTIAIGTDRYQVMTPPTVELPPSLRPMSAHPGPENRIRFLDNSVPICETPPWRCRGIHAFADEGTVLQTAPSTNFGGRYANRNQGHGPKKWLPLTEPAVSKSGCPPRLSPTSRGSRQPSTYLPARRNSWRKAAVCGYRFAWRSSCCCPRCSPSSCCRHTRTGSAVPGRPTTAVPGSGNDFRHEHRDSSFVTNVRMAGRTRCRGRVGARAIEPPVCSGGCRLWRAAQHFITGVVCIGFRTPTKPGRSSQCPQAPHGLERGLGNGARQRRGAFWLRAWAGLTRSIRAVPQPYRNRLAMRSQHWTAQRKRGLFGRGRWIWHAPSSPPFETAGFRLYKPN